MPRWRSEGGTPDGSIFRAIRSAMEKRQESQASWGSDLRSSSALRHTPALPTGGVPGGAHPGSRLMTLWTRRWSDDGRGPATDGNCAGWQLANR